MPKLEKLTQDDEGKLLRADDTPILSFIPFGLLKTFEVRNSDGLEAYVDNLCARNSVLIPKFVNAYYASEFNGATQHIRTNQETREETMFSVYAVQFVHAWQVAQEQVELK